MRASVLTLAASLGLLAPVRAADAVVRREGWHNWRKPHAERTVFYAEHGSRGPGAPAGARVPWARILSDAEASAFTPAAVLGGVDPWNPLAPD